MSSTQTYSIQKGFPLCEPCPFCDRKLKSFHRILLQKKVQTYAWYPIYVSPKLVSGSLDTILQTNSASCPWNMSPSGFVRKQNYQHSRSCNVEFLRIQISKTNKQKAPVLLDMAYFSLVMTILSYSNRNSCLILAFQLKGPLACYVTIVTNLNSNYFQFLLLCSITLCTGHFSPLLFHCFHLAICDITNLSWSNISLLPVWLLVQCIPGCPRKLDSDFQLSSPSVLNGEDCVMRLTPAYTDIF